MDLVKDKLSNFFTGGPTQYYRFEGKANFHVEVIESPDRKLPLNTSSVRLKIFSTKEKNFELPVKIKWFRLVADRNYEIEDLDNMDFYNFSAMDIGGEIKASIRSNDENFKGTISVIFGPIRFDDMLRPPLEQVLISGFSKFNVLVPTEDDGPDQMQTISVFLSPNQMKFLYYNEAEPEEFYLEILNERPRLEIVYSQSQDLALYFDEVGVEPPTRELRKRIYTDCDSAYGEKYKIILRFFSRNTRDIFVTAVRLFRIVPVVSLSNLFRQIDILVRENRMFESNSKLCLNEVLVEYDRVRTHLMSTIEYAKDLDKDREELQECVTVLERDLEHTMTEFRKYIEESMRGVAIHNRSGNNASHMNTSAYKKIEDLNASLLSNQGDMRSVIRKKIDQANPVLVAQAVQGAGAPHASLSADLQKANDEIERLKKVNAMYLAEMKKYSTDLKKYEAKRQAQKSNIKQMKEHLNNVSKEFGNLQEITEQVRGNTSGMNSKLFDVSGIESRKDEDDMFASNPMYLEPATFKKTKDLTSSSPVPQNTEANGNRKFEFGTGLPKIDESNETSTTGRTERERLTLELRAKEEEIVFLRKKIRDTENLFSENQKKLTQMMIEKSQIQQQVQVSQIGQTGKFEGLQKELATLKLKELDWKKDSEESSKFIEDMRVSTSVFGVSSQNTLDRNKKNPHFYSYG